MNSVHSQTVSLIWNIADDVLRDIFVRGQYRDVILPMVVLRRLDALLESTKVAVEEEMKLEKENGFDDLDEHAIKNITGLSYYNTSRWTLARLKQQATGDNDILYDNFAEYLNGFSKNVSDVLTKFEFFAKARKLADRDCLLPLIEKITDPFISRGVAQDAIEISGTEINPETYAICKSDLIIKNVNPDGIHCGNTLTINHFANRTFGYMITNPPYGKSWKEDKKKIYHDKELTDSRFFLPLQQFDGETADVDCCTRTSDGQLMFVLEMLDKLKPLDVQPQGSRIASVHNGSALFTGDAGQAESDIRRYLLENDLVDAIIQLPNNIFYNTGIATYCWIFTNKKEPQRQGRVQLIDASQAYEKLRKNQGNRNCTIEPYRDEILRIYQEFSECEATADCPVRCKIFDTDEFRYHSVTIERPLRLRAQFNAEHIDNMIFDPKQDELSRWLYGKYGEQVFTDLSSEIQDIREYFADNDIKITDKNFKKLIGPEAWKQRRDLQNTANRLAREIGTAVFMDYNEFFALCQSTVKQLGINISKADLDKKICRLMAVADPEADPVISKRIKRTAADYKTLVDLFGVDPEGLADYGLYADGKEYIIYESDSNLRDTEKIPVSDDIYEYFKREVKPYADDAWINLPQTKIGCEISFTKYFYEPKPLRTLAENESDIVTLDRESQEILRSILNIVG